MKTLGKVFKVVIYLAIAIAYADVVFAVISNTIGCKVETVECGDTVVLKTIKGVTLAEAVFCGVGENDSPAIVMPWLMPVIMIISIIALMRYGSKMDKRGAKIGDKLCELGVTIFCLGVIVSLLRMLPCMLYWM